MTIHYQVFLIKLTLIVLILFVITAINYVVSYISWRRRETRGDSYFVLGIMGVTLWIQALKLEYAAVPLGLKIFF